MGAADEWRGAGPRTHGSPCYTLNPKPQTVPGGSQAASCAVQVTVRGALSSTSFSADADIQALSPSRLSVR